MTLHLNELLNYNLPPTLGNHCTTTYKYRSCSYKKKKSLLYGLLPWKTYSPHAP